MGALGSIAIIWVLTIWLIAESVSRFITPPEEFNPVVMMGTAVLGIVVNLLMGMTLNQEGHRHMHVHLLGGDHECGSHHGHKSTNPIQTPLVHAGYETLDGEDKNQPHPLRSNSKSVEGQKNLNTNGHQHHKIGDDNVGFANKGWPFRILITAETANPDV